MHRSEWERLTTDEKLDHLRMHQLAQDVLIRPMTEALEGLGVTFATGAESESENPA